MANLPGWAQQMRKPPLDIALMDKWEEKIEKMVQYSLKENITSLSGVPTWMVVLAKRLLETTGKASLVEIWPNLELFLHGAVSFEPYRDLFGRLIGRNDVAYLELYNASEGFFAIQDDLSLPNQMMLMADYGIFYEFIPLSEIGSPHPKAYTLTEVERDKNYAIVISTNAGLWRYMLGDTVKFTSLSPYRITITGRTKSFINAFGEEVIVENAERAIAYACSHTHAVVADFTAAPVFMADDKKGSHEWLIEFIEEPEDVHRFSLLLDAHLRQINSDYDAKRYQNIALDFPLVRVVPPGTFHRWLKSKGKMGGQHKVPRLSNSREMLEEISALPSLV
jgi:hypothetical protein